MGTKWFGKNVKEQCPGWDKYLSRETEDAYFLDFSDCIVKLFPSGSLLYNCNLQPFTTDKECWMVVKNCVKIDGVSYYMALTDRRHATEEDGMNNLQNLRRRLEG